MRHDSLHSIKKHFPKKFEVYYNSHNETPSMYFKIFTFNQHFKLNVLYCTKVK